MRADHVAGEVAGCGTTQRPLRNRASDQPAAVLLHRLAVELDPTARAQVLDDVPVDRALVRAAGERVARAERQVDRPRHLLVEERVPEVLRDPLVAADPELAQDTRSIVGVERLHESLLAPRRRRLDDAPSAEHEPDPLDPRAVELRRELAERDLALGRVLDRPQEELAPREVQLAHVEEGLAPADTERQVGSRADDADR